MKTLLYSVYSGLSPLQEGMLFTILKADTDQKETHLYSVKFKSQLTMKLEKKRPK